MDAYHRDLHVLTHSVPTRRSPELFLPPIGRLVGRAAPPDHILIETSGLALPKPLVKAFNWPGIRGRVTVDGVIAVVDAAALAAGRFADDPEAVAAQRRADPSLDHDNPLAEVFEDQLLRSEEHTSELQSLMRISYAVFCLKKNKLTHTITNYLRNHISTTTQNI